MDRGTVNQPACCFPATPSSVTRPSAYGGDQNIINSAMPGRIDDIKAFLDVKSFKAHHIKDKKEADIISFHGRPKPWDIGWSTIKL